MRHLYHWSSDVDFKRLFQERGPDSTDTTTSTEDRERNCADEIKKHIADGTEIPDELIQAEAARCARLLENSVNIGQLIKEAVGTESLDANNLPGLSTRVVELANTQSEKPEVPLKQEQFDTIWTALQKNPPINLTVPDELKAEISQTIMAQFETKDLSESDVSSQVTTLITNELTYRKMIQALESGDHEKGEISTVEVPVSKATFEEVWKEWQESSSKLEENASGIHIPESMREEIQNHVIHNLETKDRSPEEVQKLIREMIEQHAMFLKVNQLIHTDLETGEAATEQTEKTVQKALEEIAKANGLDPQIFYKAVAGNYKGFGLDANRNPIAYNKEEYLKNANELAKLLKKDLEEVARNNPDIDITTPQGQAQALNALGGTPGNSGEFTLLDLFKMFQAIANIGKPTGDREGNNSTNRDGSPLNVSTPRGNTRSRGSMESIAGHPGAIKLNPEFYGEEMLADYEKLPENYKQAVEKITEGWDEGWKLPVIRNAINCHKQGKPFSANRPFFANDIGTKRAMIYIPNKGTIKTVCHAGSGGVSNVSGSHGSPLGSFYFQPGDTAFVPNHRYKARATVHGMEPMRESYRTPHAQGGNIDPAAGNANSAGRAILMHASRGTTWGCWGIPPEHAVTFAQAIKDHGGANGEAFVSVA